MSKTVDYKKLHDELDALLEKLQSGEVSIEEALKVFERGQEIVVELEKYLKAAENKVKKIT